MKELGREVEIQVDLVAPRQLVVTSNEVTPKRRVEPAGMDTSSRGAATVPAFVLLVGAYLPGTRIKAALGHPMVVRVNVWAAFAFALHEWLIGVRP